MFLKILAIANPDPREGGGAYRALITLKRFSQKNIEIYLVDLSPNQDFLSYNLDLSNIHILGSVNLIRNYSRRINILRKSLRSIDLMIRRSNIVPRKLLDEIMKLRGRIDLVLSFHESLEALTLAHEFSEILRVPKAAILRLPPFYGDDVRRRNILYSADIFYKSLYGGVYGSIIAQGYNFLKRLIWQRNKSLAKKYDLLISVSKSIPQEMNVSWNNIISMDPGTGIDKNDYAIISRVLREDIRRDNIILYASRSEPEKGVVEAIQIFKKLLEDYRDFRLYITSHVKDSIRSRIEIYARRLGLEKKIVFTGYLNRYELFKLMRRSRSLIYPSHEDSYSTTVLESLYLKLPVVGYEIPALKINFVEKDAKGIYLAKEYDIDTAHKILLNIISQEIDTEPPKTIFLEDIIDEQIMILRSFIRK